MSPRGGGRSLTAGLLAAVMVLGTAPLAEAAKKKKPAEQSTDGEKPQAEGAAQNPDQERPKPILDEDSGAGTPDAPKPDAQGNVNFGGNKSAKGRITVKAPPDDKVKIYLEGRYFGAAPRTIHKVPAGDYIIELVLPGGKRVARPVSVSSDEEALVEVAGVDPAAAAAAEKEKPMTEDQLQNRWKWAKIVGIGGIAALGIGAALGIYGQFVIQGQYDDKFNMQPPPGSDQMVRSAYQAELDDLRSRGNIMVNTANVLYVLGAAAIVTSVVLGYPVYKARKAGGAAGGRNKEGLEAAPPPPPMTFIFSPYRDGGGIAGMSFTF